MILACESVQAKKKNQAFPDKNQVSFANLVSGSIQVGKKSKNKSQLAGKLLSLHY
jgi:hypothetical protein